MLPSRLVKTLNSLILDYQRRMEIKAETQTLIIKTREQVWETIAIMVMLKYGEVQELKITIL